MVNVFLDHNNWRCEYWDKNIYAVLMLKLFIFHGFTSLGLIQFHSHNETLKRVMFCRDFTTLNHFLNFLLKVKFQNSEIDLISIEVYEQENITLRAVISHFTLVQWKLGRYF